MKDAARFDSAMSDQTGRTIMLDAMRSGGVCYEGSKGFCYELGKKQMQWLALRGVSVRALSVRVGVPQSVVETVVSQSPGLLYLHVHYSDGISQLIETIQKRCFKLEEIMLRYTTISHCLSDQGELRISYVNSDRDSLLCARPRLKIHSWLRSPDGAKAFGAKRLVLMSALRLSPPNAELMKQILIEDSNLSFESKDCSLCFMYNSIGCTALMTAAKHDSCELINLILQNAPDCINLVSLASPHEYNEDNFRSLGPPRYVKRDYAGTTALMYACYLGHAAAIELLIRSGADVDLCNSYGESAFDLLDKFGIDGARKLVLPHSSKNRVEMSLEEMMRLKDLPRLIQIEKTVQL